MTDPQKPPTTVRRDNLAEAASHIENANEAIDDLYADALPEGQVRATIAVAEANLAVAALLSALLERLPAGESR